MEIFLKFRGENNKHLKPPPSTVLVIHNDEIFSGAPYEFNDFLLWFFSEKAF